MARVTVEDCIDKVSNRFQLVMLAAHRARSLSSGAQLTVDRDNDKNPVVALREIADETIDLTELEDLLVKSLQKHVETDELDEEDPDILSAADAYTGELMPPIEQPAPEEDEISVWRRVAPADDEDYDDDGDQDSGDGDAPDFSGQDINEAEE